MLYKLLGVHTEKELNIGDYIQALASAQFLPSINGFVQRENLKEYDEDDAKVIMNGWYMHRPVHWPASCKIHPFFDIEKNLKTLFVNSCYLASHYKIISTISKKFPSQRKGFRKLIKVVSFYKQYKTVFSKEVLLGAKYINQQSIKWKEICPTDEIALEKAEELVKMYASANFVVTSRIHCALPCLGLEAPVIFTDNIKQSVASSCRLDGLKELFNVIECDGSFFKPKFKIGGIISDKNNIPANKDNWKLLSDKLIKTCLSFVNKH